MFFIVNVLILFLVLTIVSVNGKNNDICDDLYFVDQFKFNFRSKTRDKIEALILYRDYDYREKKDVWFIYGDTTIFSEISDKYSNTCDQILKKYGFNKYENKMYVDGSYFYECDKLFLASYEEFHNQLIYNVCPTNKLIKKMHIAYSNAILKDSNESLFSDTIMEEYSYNINNWEIAKEYFRSNGFVKFDKSYYDKHYKKNKQQDF
jgi:hypothetical protein